MKRNNLVKFNGEIIKILPNSMYIINILSLNRKVVCYLCGKLRIKYLKFIIGDKVIIEFDKSNLSKGRIIGILNESKSFN